jgi:hypothetical protein
VELSRLELWSRQGTSAAELDYPKNEGEVQILDQFASRVEHAVRARASLFPGQEGRPLAEEERRQVWAFGEGAQG